jgi:hypothetical protein
MGALKTINYRGGIAKFRVPRSWMEEYDPAGGGTFYEDAPDSGTLRINVLGFEKPAGAEGSWKSAREMLGGLDASRQVEELPSGAAIGRSNSRVVEGNEELRIYTWQIGVVVTPAYFRILVFTYTILARLESDPAVQEELKLVDKWIADGVYPAIRGVAGDYYQ